MAEKRIVVVTDDPRLADMARYGFAPDLEIEVVADAREALASMARAAPAVAVVDLQTGSAGGFALARDMHQSDRLKEVPILMLLERDQDSWLAKQAGANAIRVKPLGVAQLVADTLALI
jgi:DNA-binding response OmpR family regulator